MPALNRHSNKPPAPQPRPLDSERERLPTSGIQLSADEIALLQDPAWMDEDEADAITAMRAEKESAGKTIPIEHYMRDRGIPLPPHK